MLRLINNLNFLKMSLETVSNYSTTFNPAMLPVVKCHRKPRWVPVAKSKRFRIPERPKIPEDEQKELLRLHNNYRTYVKSLKRYLVQKHCVSNQASLDPEEILKHFKEDLQKCSEINDKWNKEVKVFREKRIAQELEEEIERALQKIDMESKKQQEIQQLTEQIVKKQKAASVHFITPENIDKAIDTALATTTDYNFAIEVNGEKILGRETQPMVEQKVSIKQ